MKNHYQGECLSDTFLKWVALKKVEKGMSIDVLLVLQMIIY